MRILFYYESLVLGGQQTQTLNIIREIDESVEVFFAFNQDGEMRPDFEQVSKVIDLKVPINSPSLKSMLTTLTRTYFSLSRVIKQHKIDVVISGSGYGSVIAGLAARRRGIRHHRFIGCSLIQVEKRLYKYYRKLGIDRLIDKYYGIQAFFDELRAKGVNEKKLIPFPYGVNTELFTPPSEQERQRKRESLDIPADHTTLGWIGRVAENMQITFTIDLAIELKKRGFDKFTLVIVGGGSWEQQMLGKIKKNQLDEQVRYLGWQPMKEVPGFIAAMDIVPLLEEDPRGGSILREAMSCGKVAPTVDGASGAQAEFVFHEKNGILVGDSNFISEAADWCIRLHNDRPAMEKIQDGARAYVLQEMSHAIQARIIERECQ